jgi:hypothetical protein
VVAMQQVMEENRDEGQVPGKRWTRNGGGPRDRGGC